LCPLTYRLQRYTLGLSREPQFHKPNRCWMPGRVMGASPLLRRMLLGAPPASANASKSIELVYRSDETTTAQWFEPDGTFWKVFYMRWNHGSKTGQLAKGHWPDLRLGNAGLVLRGEVQTRQYEVHNVKLPFRVYAFE